jgi:elongation factor P
MISYSQLKKGIRILFRGQPYEILESSPMFKGRGHSVLQAKIKNLATGQTIAFTFRPSDSFEEPDLLEIELKFLYGHQGKYVFCESGVPAKRFELTRDAAGRMADFLKPEQVLKGLIFDGKLAAVSLPVKIRLKVKEAPPAIKGQSAQAATKTITLETGARINVPLFIESGDLIEINSQTGAYVKRIG